MRIQKFLKELKIVEKRISDGAQVFKELFCLLKFSFLFFSKNISLQLAYKWSHSRPLDNVFLNQNNSTLRDKPKIIQVIF